MSKIVNDLQFEGWELVGVTLAYRTEETKDGLTEFNRWDLFFKRPARVPEHPNAYDDLEGKLGAILIARTE